jgi:hypothetical protein
VSRQFLAHPVNISVEFGDEGMSFSVIVPNQVSDEQKKVPATG